MRRQKFKLGYFFKEISEAHLETFMSSCACKEHTDQTETVHTTVVPSVLLTSHQSWESKVLNFAAGKCMFHHTGEDVQASGLCGTLREGPGQVGADT